MYAREVQDLFLEELILPLIEKNKIDKLKIAIETIGPKIDLNSKSTKGDTPLIAAAKAGNETIVKMLIDAKADIHTQSHDGTTALIASAYHNHYLSLKTLLEAKANPDIQDEEGNIPLHQTALYNDIASLQILLKITKNTNHKNLKSETPLDCTSNYQSLQLIQSASSKPPNRLNHFFQTYHDEDSSSNKPRSTKPSRQGIGISPTGMIVITDSPGSMGIDPLSCMLVIGF